MRTAYTSTDSAGQAGGLIADGSEDAFELALPRRQVSTIDMREGRTQTRSGSGGGGSGVWSRAQVTPQLTRSRSTPYDDPRGSVGRAPPALRLSLSNQEGCSNSLWRSSSRSLGRSSRNSLSQDREETMMVLDRRSLSTSDTDLVE